MCLLSQPALGRKEALGTYVLESAFDPGLTHPCRKHGSQSEFLDTQSLDCSRVTDDPPCGLVSGLQVMVSVSWRSGFAQGEAGEGSRLPDFLGLQVVAREEFRPLSVGGCGPAPRARGN